ncbi:MAG: 3-hydroxyacyl-CoA dehydrogenase [Petrotogales bacterium]
MTRYLANGDKKEIHDLENEQENCQIEEIKLEHRESLDSLERALRYIREYGYNGCKWCLPQYHTD